MNRLLEFRSSNGLTQSSIAAMIGVSKSFYEKIEAGERNPSYGFVTRFKKAFPEVDVDTLFFEFPSHETCLSSSITHIAKEKPPA